jgi:hypothetical protein
LIETKRLPLLSLTSRNLPSQLYSYLVARETTILIPAELVIADIGHQVAMILIRSLLRIDILGLDIAFVV